MKKTARLLILIALVLVCGLATTIVFLTIPDKRLDTATFWIAWSFAIPWNLVAAVILHFWSGHKTSEDIVQMPVAYYLSAIFGVVYLVIGILFMYLPITGTTFLIILELIVTVAYIIVAMYLLYAADYVTNSQKQTKQKVQYIRMLKADVDDCIAKAQGAEIRKALIELSEKIRFSDPMSHPSLAGIEGELSGTVSAIYSKLSEGAEDEAMELVKKSGEQLERRNNRCLMLK